MNPKRVRKPEQIKLIMECRQSGVSCAPVMQEVVKLDLVESGMSTPAMMEQNISPSVLSGVPSIAAEIECGNIRVCIFNGADPAVVQNTFQCIGGMSHAW